MSGGWRRVTRARPCPICEHASWCGVAADGSAAICMRVESDERTRNDGWLHRLTEAPRSFRRHVARIAVRTDWHRNLGQLASRYARAAPDRAVQRLAEQLGVSAESLRRLGVGWDGESWTFAMRDSTGQVVGIRRRFPNGRKLSVKGGREGLFVPTNLPDGGELFVCEGPTDTAAMLSLGLEAIGRPSCRGGVAELAAFVKARRPAPVIVFGDSDPTGRAGAAVLGGVLRLHCLSVRVAIPPKNAKDARAWVHLGATAADVRRLVQRSEPVGISLNANRQSVRSRRLREETSNA